MKSGGAEDDETPIGRMRALWTAVLARMLLDACGSLSLQNPQPGDRDRVIDEARLWLCSDDFEIVADYSFFEFEEVEKWAETVLKHPPWEGGRAAKEGGSPAEKVVRALRERGF